MFKGMRQVRLLKSATRKLQSGAEMSSVMEDVSKYYETNPLFANVLHEFNATLQDVEGIIISLMAAGAGETWRGHFVPISAVLYPLTLSYLLRVRRGKVPAAQAYFEILEYFRSGAMTFGPEQAIRHSRAKQSAAAMS